MSYGHQDQIFRFNYGNIEVRFQTGFNYEEINNAKIIGTYAATLCDSLNYNEPVLLDFVHDYTHTYKGNVFSFVCYAGDSYELVSKDKPNSNNNNEVEITQKLIIRQFGAHFAISQTLELLLWGINHKEWLIKNQSQVELQSYMYDMKYSMVSISESKIKSIKKNNSDIVKSVLENEVCVRNDERDYNQTYFSYFSQNNKYLPYIGLNGEKTIIDTLDNIYYFIKIDNWGQYLFVFNSPNQFTYYRKGFILEDEIYISSKLHKIECVDNFEYFVDISAELITDDVFFIKYFENIISINPKIVIYLEKDDIVICNFKEYIDSNRGK